MKPTIVLIAGLVASALAVSMVFGGAARAILAVDDANNRVLMFSAETGELVREVVAASGELSGPMSVAPGPTVVQNDQTFSRTVLVGDIRRRRVAMFDELSGAFLREWVAGVDASGLLKVDNEWLLAGARAGVMAISSSGVATTRIAPEIVLGPNNSWSVLHRPATESRAADILVSDATLDVILRFDPSGARLGVFARRGEFRFTQQLALRAGGNVLVADPLANRVFEFDDAGGFVRAIVCAHPRGVAELTGGNLLIASDDGVQVFESVNGTSLATTLAGLPANAVRNLAVVSCSGLAGDLNGDGRVNAFDIDPFVLALTDESAFAEQFPMIDRFCAGDINRDDHLNSFDIDPFVALLVGG
ncbi:MAG: hypothetical protein JNG88_15985 [Phycisphaerales bacterium]|nr:hypothetical protein [Phycisphaerales bacterium]